MQKTADLSGRISVSIEDDLPDAEGTVIGCFVTLGAACAVPADGERAETHLRLQGKGTAHVLIGDARGELTCYDKTFLWQPDGVWPGTVDAAWPSMGAAAVRVVSSKSGARLRVDLEIETSGILMQAANTDALCDVELGEAYDDADGPACTSIMPGRGNASLTLPSATMRAPGTLPPPTISIRPTSRLRS